MPLLERVLGLVMEIPGQTHTASFSPARELIHHGMSQGQTNLLFLLTHRFALSMDLRVVNHAGNSADVYVCGLQLHNNGKACTLNN